MVPVASTRALCKLNLSILSQKLSLFQAVVDKHGAVKAGNLFKSTCPIVGATIGQHIRHSMDHIELTILMANSLNDISDSDPIQLHYDLRVRGGTTEHCMDASKKRVLDACAIIEEMLELPSINTKSHQIQANFMLSGDGFEFGLPSTIAREMGFVAHHAIHHMAMIKLIAIHHVGLEAKDLPLDFGRAPATIHHENS
mmetsp:Transcript_925/g.1151  ORF Transcript_925/g.1151 Transcript_925/m.1151 type:complete len:198 (-) Transcript_925:5975-6568(-)